MHILKRLFIKFILWICLVFLLYYSKLEHMLKDKESAKKIVSDAEADVAKKAAEKWYADQRASYNARSVARDAANNAAERAAEYAAEMAKEKAVGNSAEKAAIYRKTFAETYRIKYFEIIKSYKKGC